MRTSLEYLKNNFNKVPPDLQDAILSVDFLDALNEIQKNQALHIDQAAALEELTFKVMLGDVDETEYVKEISSELSIETEKALVIAKEVERNIFQPIIASFKESQRLEEEAEEEGVEDEGANEPKLNAKDILAEIEHPHPSVGIIEETSIPITTTTTSTATPPASSPIITAPDTDIPKETQQTTPPVLTNLPSGWPAPATPANSAAAPQQTPPPAVNTPSPINTALNQKLEQPTVTKPVQISHTIDPYKEPIE